jgi:acyl-CoA thioester hydrolase
MKESSRRITNVTSYRVIYGDTDKMGMVYYANYLRWFEKGRSEFLRQMGMPYTAIEERGTHFPVTDVSCRYFKSARYDDLITIETELASVARATLTFNYRILRVPEGCLLAAGSTKHACIDSRGRVVRIPMDLRNLFSSVIAPADRLLE